MSTQKVNEELLKERKILRRVPCDDGVGYELTLECGHEIWMAIDYQGERIPCGACLNQLVEQCRQVQASQGQR